jgi:hypothetical protein
VLENIELKQEELLMVLHVLQDSTVLQVLFKISLQLENVQLETSALVEVQQKYNAVQELIKTKQNKEVALLAQVDITA